MYYVLICIILYIIYNVLSAHTTFLMTISVSCLDVLVGCFHVLAHEVRNLHQGSDRFPTVSQFPLKSPADNAILDTK